MDRTIK